MLKPTPIWDDLGCSGMNREGWGIAEIAVIDVSRKTKTSPRINTDDTDQE